MANERSIALHWLSTLSNKEFAEFFYSAVAERRTSDIKDWQGHFVLADAQKVQSEPWAIDFIAIPEGKESWSADAPICQSGGCGTCGALIRSWAKNAVCPICGSAAGLT